MAILEAIQDTIDGRTDQAQTAGVQAAYPEIRAVLGDIFSSQSGAACLSGRKTGQSVANPIIALIQQIRQEMESQPELRTAVERISSLTGMLAGQRTINEADPRSEGFVTEASDGADVPARGMEQTILLSLARLLGQKGPITGSIGEKGLEGDKRTQEDSVEERRANEGVMAEIVATLLRAEKSGGAVQPLAIPQPGKDILLQEGGLESFPDGKSGYPADMWAQLNPVASGAQAGISASKTSTELDPGEESAQTTSGTTAAQPAANGVAPSAVPSAFMPPSRAGSNIAGDSEESAKLGDGGREGRGEDGDGIGKDPAYKEGRVVRNVTDNPLTQTFKNPSLEQNGSVARGQGQSNDAWHHAKIFYSRFHEGNEEGAGQIMAQGQQVSAQESNGPVKKVVGEVQSILGRNGSVEAADLGPVSRSQSSAEREGDSQGLGQGMAEQRFTERATATGSNGTTSFGDIVADRIARTVEHIAQTNRSDLTLRLKIDGGESVVLAMKERAGTVVIGIQCQDKSLVKALESQKDLIVRNLETKNVSTSISISAIGDDEREGQGQWQRERHGRERHGWNERPTVGSPSYFETFI